MFCRYIWKQFKNIKDVWNYGDDFVNPAKKKGIWYSTAVSSSSCALVDGQISRCLLKALFRLRSGHIPLNGFYYLMGKAVS